MNTIILRRVNVGADASVKEIEGQKVLEFSVADNRQIKDSKGEKKEFTTWYRCSYWTNRTNLADYLKKGVSVNVIGKLSAGTYTNKQGGTGIDLKVTVQELDLLTHTESKKETEEPEILSDGKDRFPEQYPAMGPAEDDLPF